MSNSQGAPAPPTTPHNEGANDYRIISSPLGTLLLISTDYGLARIAFEHENFDQLLAEVGSATATAKADCSAHLNAAELQLQDYFSGTRRQFDVALDRRRATGFTGAAQKHLDSIPYGSTKTYRQVAEGIGNPAAVRAVGNACATNPLPLLVPCHRVLRSDGGLGGYRGGPSAKAWLLELETKNIQYINS